MTAADILKFVDDLYATTALGDFAKLETMLADDFFITEAPGLPMAGTYRGKAALEELFVQVMGMLDVSGLERISTTASDDGTGIAVVLMHFAGEGLKSAELCELFRFRDGKCCEIRPYYFDPAALHAAAAAKLAHHSA